MTPRCEASGWSCPYEGRHPLTEGWALRHDSSRVPAQVPGCVHTDLLTAGLIPDPFLSRNENDVGWVGRRDWRYDTVLAPRDSDHERTDLVFDGLDTAAAVVIGGEVIGRTRNMHRGYRFDITGKLDAEDPETAETAGTGLSVLFTSAYTEAEAVRAQLGERPNSYPEPFQYIRKMACSFGWDWGPTLVTAGIWKPARLEHWSTARLAGVRPLVTVDAGTGRVEVRIEVERTASGAGQQLTADLRVGDRPMASVRFDGPQATVTSEVAGPALWWPRGYGEQPLYDCEVILRDGSGAPSTAGRAASASVPSPSTPPPMSTAPASPWWSTASGSSPAGSTGFPTTSFPPGSPPSVTAPASPRPPKPGWT